MWGAGLFRSDLSEIGGLDYLHAPTGPLDQAQRLAAEAFGADYTRFLINGSTVGNHAAVLSCVRPGQKVLVARASHRSVYAALLLSDAVPIFIPPRYHRDAGVPLAVDVTDVAELLREHPDIAAIHITSPSYYGTTTNVAACAHLARSAGVPLLVDEAHGAHFCFHPALPDSALQAGADLTVQSTHKTLGALYQASMLHGRRGIVAEGRVQQTLAMLQSSSPSALLLASLDAARATMATEGRCLLEGTVTLAERARTAIGAIPGLRCYGAELIGSGGVHDYDRTKLLIRVSGLGLTGFEAGSRLARRYGVEVELCDAAHVLCSLTIYDTADDVARLLSALTGLARDIPCERAAEREPCVRSWPGIPVQAMSAREAAFAPSQPCPLHDAVGMICAESVIPYPPGIPVLLPGEVISAEVVAFCEQLTADGAKIVGAADARLCTIQVVTD
jgi:arginine/lysine/ornithine decarboxylase